MESGGRDTGKVSSSVELGRGAAIAALETHRSQANTGEERQILRGAWVPVSRRSVRQAKNHRFSP